MLGTQSEEGEDPPAWKAEEVLVPDELEQLWRASRWQTEESARIFPIDVDSLG